MACNSPQGTEGVAKVPDYYVPLDSVPLKSGESIQALNAQNQQAALSEKAAFSSPRLQAWLKNCDTTASGDVMMRIVGPICTLTDQLMDSLTTDEAIFFFLAVKEVEHQNCSGYSPNEWKWDIIPTSFSGKGNWLGQSHRQQLLLERDSASVRERVTDFLAGEDHISPEMLSLIRILQVK